MKINVAVVAFAVLFAGCGTTTAPEADASNALLASTTAGAIVPPAPPNPLEEQGEQIQSLIEAGEYVRALGMLSPYLEEGVPATAEALQAIRVLAALTQNWPLAVRCAQKSAQMFPEQALDFGATEVSCLLLEKLYDPALQKTKELVAAAETAPEEVRADFLMKVLGFSIQAFQQKEPVDSRMYLTLLKKQANLPPRLLTAARSLEADFLLQEQKYSAARVIIADLLREDPENLMLAAMINRIDADATLVESLMLNVERTSSDWVLWTRLLVLSTESPDIDKLFERYDVARREKDLKPAEILYQLYAESLQKQNRGALSTEALQAALKDYPDSPSIKNSLAYTYALENNNLPEAETLARDAVKTEPENPAYLDTLGWVLYRKGQFDASLQYLLSAAEQLRDNPEVLEHVGDALNAIGKREEALEFWRRAAALEPDVKFLQNKIEGLK